MRVLWLCNTNMDPDAERESGGGWITSLKEQIAKVDDIQLGICYCPGKNKGAGRKERDGITYYAYQKKIWPPEYYDESVEHEFRRILKEYRPDIVHIFGTEFPHTLAMVKAFHNPDKTVIHIQGLVSVIAKHYTTGLTDRECRMRTFRDIIRRDNIYHAQRSFAQRGKWEIKALKGVKHVFGRTTWDYACVMQNNPGLQYHYCSEVMRDVFYGGSWKYQDCNKHSIFMSQGSYPVKGVHQMLSALPIIKKKYPDTKVYIAGDNILNKGIRESSYAAILKQRMLRNHVENMVEYIGSKDAKGMKEQLLRANVFVSASLIENSPNSIGEAMLLGVPVISSNVGGVPDLLMHKKEGFLYQADAPYMLAYYVMKVFDMEEKVEEICSQAKKTAMNHYSKSEVTKTVLDVYRQL